MQKLWDVAPPMTWAVLGLAAVLLLAGFVLLSHSLVRRKAYGDRYHGLTHPGRLEWTLRAGVACLLGGGALWALELAAPGWAVAGLAAFAALAAGTELLARMRG